ncbi:AraC-like DNA-binding protein [Pseudomonas sp. SJZ079]|uniref:helix-turn-helix transcriptional regulator n=1 Tax=Pseudomonas sp. SJZ079 TaxID=2572887 RepID=UPI00119BD54E|nr:AraC family transcriptional regulator [Pseudomonas sp. SJZ079]TWC26996.1 AraC-like DNA-binding protein [Pseudomonas sp. SJZ079]
MIAAPSETRDRKWSTRDASHLQPINAFNAMVSAEIAEMSVHSELNSAFSASWVRYGLGPVDLNFLQCAAQKTSRSIEMTSRDKKPFFEFLFAREGRILVSHHGESTIVHPGSFILLSDRYPYTLEFPDGSNCLTAHMPEDWLSTWVADPHRLIGKPLGAGDVWARPLTGLLTAVADSGLETSSVPRFVLADQFGALCSLIMNQPSADKHDSELAKRIKEGILEHHQSHMLSPSVIANEMAISTRHLHRVLSSSGTSFSSLLTSIRLERAVRLLANPMHGKVSIGEISWLCGFVDQSHFARLFKAAYGATPSQYRTQHCGKSVEH